MAAMGRRHACSMRSRHRLRYADKHHPPRAHQGVVERDPRPFPTGHFRHGAAAGGHGLPHVQLRAPGRQGAWPGLDIAFLLDAAAYHTDRDTTARIRRGTLQARPPAAAHP